MTDAEPIPMGKFEWERLILRIAMPDLHQRLSLILAVFADADGTRVRPGNEILASVTRKTTRTVIRALNDLREWQLIAPVSRGGGRGGKGRTTEYRLTCPTDLLERFELLTPNLRPAPKSGDAQTSPQTVTSSVDNQSTTVDNPAETVDNSSTRNANEVTPVSPETANEVTNPANEVTPRCRTTNQDHQPPKATRPDVVATRGDSRPRVQTRDPPTRPISATNHPDAPPEPT
ncbi:hypothetical protein [Actinophytocola sediminis]